MVLELPSQDDLDYFRKIEVLAAPDGLQDLEYNVTKVKTSTLNKYGKPRR